MSTPPPPSFSTLTVEITDRLGRLTLNQPDKLNPIGTQALRELVEAAQWFDEAEATVVVVRGAGEAFCSGFDRRELASSDAAGAPLDPTAPAADTPALGAAMAEAISGMRAVTVAAIRGACVGGGFVLAMCCDLRVATYDAFFSLPEVELGIPLAWSGIPRLVRELGTARTMELVLTGRRVAPQEMSNFGILNRVVDPMDLDDTIEDLASMLLARREIVVVATKRQVEAAAESMVATTGNAAGTAELIAALRSLRDPA